MPDKKPGSDLKADAPKTVEPGRPGSMRLPHPMTARTPQEAVKLKLAYDKWLAENRFDTNEKMLSGLQELATAFSTILSALNDQIANDNNALLDVIETSEVALKQVESPIVTPRTTVAPLKTGKARVL